MALIYNLDHISDKQKKTNIRKAIGILEKAYYSKTEAISFFLDPFEQKIIKDIADKNHIDITFLGGNEKAERKIFVVNYYYLPLYAPNYISVLEFECEGITHPDVLGSLISLGIDRNDIGDISILKNKAQFVVDKEVAPFIEFNLTKIKNQSIKLKLVENSELYHKKEVYENHNGFVSSLRLDNLVSLFISTSRGKAGEVIVSRFVKVDFQMMGDPSYNIKDGSLISIRRYGRFIFDGIDGTSKKGNLHIKYRKIL